MGINPTARSIYSISFKICKKGFTFNKINIEVEVICIEDAAFYALIKKVVAELKPKNELQQPDKWISGIEAMNLLRIKSKTTLQKLRDEGQIRYTQPEKKIILYDRDSILAYLEDFIQEPFEQWKKK